MFLWGKSDEFKAEAFQLCTPMIVAHDLINDGQRLVAIQR